MLLFDWLALHFCGQAILFRELTDIYGHKFNFDLSIKLFKTSEGKTEVTQGPKCSRHSVLLV